MVISATQENDGMVLLSTESVKSLHGEVSQRTCDSLEFDSITQDSMSQMLQ